MNSCHIVSVSKCWRYICVFVIEEIFWLSLELLVHASGLSVSDWKNFLISHGKLFLLDPSRTFCPLLFSIHTTYRICISNFCVGLLQLCFYISSQGMSRLSSYQFVVKVYNVVLVGSSLGCVQPNAYATLIGSCPLSTDLQICWVCLSPCLLSVNWTSHRCGWSAV
jgi:hypothetical protein